MQTFGFPLNPPGESVPEAPSIPYDSGVELTDKEKALRNLFVSEYLKDYDKVAAAQRCGFELSLAVDWANKLMAEPYVQIRLSNLRNSGDVNQIELADYNRRRIKEGLMTQAFYTGPGSSHAARVSALKALAELEGMVKVPSKSAGIGDGGVMQVPGIAGTDDWEAAASNSQDALARHAGTGE